MTTAPARTRTPVTQILPPGSASNRTAEHQLQIWSGGDWMTFTFNDNDPTAFAAEPTTQVVRTVAADELGNMVSVMIGTGHNATEYAITRVA